MKYTFAQYISSKMLIDFIVKERIKIAANKTLSQKTKKKKDSKEDSSSHEESMSMADLICSMVPPRNKWRRLRKYSRGFLKSKEERNRASLKNTINYDLRKYREGISEAPDYLNNLIDFIGEIQDAIISTEPLDFKDSIKVIAQFKENDGDTAIYRPLSVYTSLKDKALISMASAYLAHAFNPYLHEEILSYRPARNYHGKEAYATTGDDAIEGIVAFAKKHKDKQIYVAECDIQKFYDIINHDVVLDCFKKLAEEAQIPEYSQVERILKAYLDSYSFYDNVMKYNEDEAFWLPYRKLQKKNAKNHCRFKWVSDDAFLTCYPSQEELDKAKTKLGVPQGGALSCVVSNVVLNSVDKAVVNKEDPDLFFARYGDDIILAHIDFEKCKAIMDSYVNSLSEHFLPHHPFKPLNDCKDGEKTTKDFWNIKSKAPFLWGPGGGNAFEWVGFVGYEIRYTGETRLRLSTWNKKFALINKRYHACLLKDDPKNFGGYMSSNYKKIDGLSSSIKKMSALDLNQYTSQQMKSLDRYRHTKIRRLQEKLTERFEDQLFPRDLTKIYSNKNEDSAKYSFYRTLESIKK